MTPMTWPWAFSGEHRHRDAQDAPEQHLQVELLGQGAGDLEQIVTLADAEVREHEAAKKVRG